MHIDERIRIRKASIWERNGEEKTVCEDSFARAERETERGEKKETIHVSAKGSGTRRGHGEDKKKEEKRRTRGRRRKKEGQKGAGGCRERARIRDPCMQLKSTMAGKAQTMHKGFRIMRPGRLAGAGFNILGNHVGPRAHPPVLPLRLTVVFSSCVPSHFHPPLAFFVGPSSAVEVGRTSWG